MSAAKTTPIAGIAPQGDALTDYDRAQVKLYARLLDAERGGARLGEIARVLFGIDAEAEPQRALDAVESHLARARWMSEHGYRALLDGRAD